MARRSGMDTPRKRVPLGWAIGSRGTEMKTDVLIVGAGPVGMTMACELARYGLSVRIVDKNNCRTDQSKAIVVWSRTLELLNRMGPGVTDRFVQAGIKA